MAAPVTHIVLADKVFKKHFDKRDRRAFMVGTSFPDIRYLGIIAREKTHSFGESLGEIKTDSDFNAGFRLHSMVDEIREQYMQQHSLYSLFPESQLVSQGVKMFEDQVLYQKIQDWAEVSGYFKEILSEEKDFGLAEVDLHKWHGWLATYFSDPSVGEVSIHQFVNTIGRPPEMAIEMIRIFKGVKDFEKAKEIVLKFYNEFGN
jgi:hypothetical protein